MTGPTSVPIRVRITAAFAIVILVLLAGVGAVVYLTMRAALLDEIDTELRFRATSILSVPQAEFRERRTPGLDVQLDEAFDQLLTRAGTVLRATPGLPSGTLITADDLAQLRRPTFFQRPVAGVQDQARMLAIPLTGANQGKVLVVGATTSDRTDALHQLSIALIGGGGVSVALASLAGWLVAGLALRPVERIRRQASAITASGLDRRLEVPTSRDELHRLATTLNDMLGRLDQAVGAERRFLARASHELRTPLAALQAELELASSRPRSPEELTAAVSSAAAETDRIVRLANDLLSLARSRDGVLPVRREAVNLHELLEGAVDRFRSRALMRGQELTVDGPSTLVSVDPVRLRQALDNLLDNALRHAPDGGQIEVTGVVGDGECRITVRDTGPGFASRDPAHTADGERAGLGLQIVSTIAAGHNGDVQTADDPRGGAAVTIRIRDEATS